MAAVDTIRKYKWPLIAVQVVSALALLVGLLATQGQSLVAPKFALVYGAGFVASLALFPLCYLAWFGGPNLPALTAIHRTVFWLASVLWLFFWVRVLTHVVSS